MSGENKSSTEVTEEKRGTAKEKQDDRRPSLGQAEEGKAGEGVKEERRLSTEQAEEGLAEKGKDREDAGTKQTEKKGAGGGDPKKLTIIAIGILTLLLIIILSAALSSGSTEIHVYEKKSCDSRYPTSAEINSCLKENCTFDESTCDTSCPFGYQLGDDGCEESCECAMEGVMEGDIPFTPTDVESLVEEYGLVKPEEDFAVFGASDETTKLWQHYEHDDPSGFVIYYVFDKIPNNKVSMVERVLEHIEDKTCIKFESSDQKRPYFVFSNRNAGCTSEIGYKGIWRQTINLGPSCYTPSIIKHQLLHLLGLAHEHTRSDRNAYINILEENISPGRLANFRRRTGLEHASQAAYDLSSILQYDGYIYSKNNEATIRRVDDGEPVVKQLDYSKGDIEELNTLYGCLNYEPNEAQWTFWSEWSLCGSECNVPGFRSRYRRCESASQELVTGCHGSKVESEECIGRCVTQAPSARFNYGKWEYGPAGKCTVTCGGGIALRQGTCVPVGARCDGSSYKKEPCNEQSCGYEETPYWGEWGEWSRCSATCGNARKRRERYCYNRRNEIRRCGKDKLDMMTQKEHCFEVDCPFDWSFVDDTPHCSASCDGVSTEVDCVYSFCSETVTPCNVGACKNLEPELFKNHKEKVADVLCFEAKGTYWYFRDFNGDKRDDAFCINSGGFIKIGFSNSEGKLVDIDWKGMLEGCNTGWAYMGDFNGDGNFDILCRSFEPRKLTIHFASKTGGFGGSTMDAGNFCTTKKDGLYPMDVNADGKYDLICHYEDKSVELRLNTL